MQADDLSGKVAVITGASKGIGRTMARALVAAGARVAVLARRSPELEQIAAELGETSQAIACDVSDPAQVRDAMARAAERFGRIDVLVNNAALCEPHLVEKSSDQQIRAEIGVNLMGPIFCAREAIPHLKKAGGGHIVNVSSESVRMPFPYLSVYVATKGGLEAFSAGLRTELRADGVRVTVLRLGNVGETSIIDNWADPVKSEYFAHITKSGHLTFVGGLSRPSSIAQALVNVLTLPEDVNVDLVEIRSR